MRAEHFSPDVREFLALLHTHDVRYVLVGGEAVIYYGHVRLTGDVDFFFERTRENAQRLFRALEEFWGGNVPGVSGPDELVEPDTVVQFGLPPNRIDILNTISGVDFERAWRGRNQEQLEGVPQVVPLNLIGLDELIENKRAAGRDKDRDDLRYLERRRRR